MSDPEELQVSAEASTESGHAETPVLTVVGLGGSAGSLTAFERFFMGIPTGSQMSFVVVSHLDPQYPSLLPELLQRCTLLPVVPILSGMSLQADHVYVIPPGFSLTMLRGNLLLEPLENAHGRVIDTFFANLAADQAERAVGVILSGMGDDGARGLEAIKAHGGLAMVQDPASADFPSMPQQAIDLGVVDHVLSAEELATHLYERIPPGRMLDADDLRMSNGYAELQRILMLIRAKLGHDFTQYKPSTLIRRIDRRMKSQRIQGLGAYRQFLEQQPAEIETLFQDLTINVTSFFRDPDAFVQLKDQLRASMLIQAGGPLPQESVRAWVAGCATGEEAYSVAIVLHELNEELGTQVAVQLFATDIDPQALHTARLGIYPHSIAQMVSPQRLGRYFRRIDEGYQILSTVRESVIFALHNTFSDPPFTRLNLVCCRNMLIYLNTELQQQILSVFHYALHPGGLMFLGTSESLGQERSHFTALDHHWRIYRRGSDPARPLSPGPIHVRGALAVSRSVPDASPDLPGIRQRTLYQQVQRMLLDQYAPPAVVVNASGEILFVNGRTARYLELPAETGGPNNVLSMVRDGLSYELAAAIQQVQREQRELTIQTTSAGTSESLQFALRPIMLAEQKLVLISFHEQATADAAVSVSVEQLDELETLKRELMYSRETLHATREEMMISMEELRSINEEYQTTIEELKSTNEELMTSKEELQSVNEELITSNNEHHLMIADLGQAHDDMKNLLESAGIATLFLTNDLKIKRFTAKITSLIRLIPGDLGRPISDFSSRLQHANFVRDLQQVVDTLSPLEMQVQAEDNEWYLMRINPYRTSDNFIDGVVVTLTNIDTVKRLEADRDTSLLYAEALLGHMPDAVAVVDEHSRLITANPPFYQLLQTTQAKARGKQLLALSTHAVHLSEIQRRLDDVILTEVPLRDFLTDFELPGLGSQRFKVEAWPVVSADGEQAIYLLLLENLSAVFQQMGENGESVAGDMSDDQGQS